MYFSKKLIFLFFFILNEFFLVFFNYFNVLISKINFNNNKNYIYKLNKNILKINNDCNFKLAVRYTELYYQQDFPCIN
jgi:hypothetical protein